MAQDRPPLTDSEKAARFQAAWLNGAFSQEAEIDLTRLSDEEIAEWDALADQANNGTPGEQSEATAELIARGWHDPSGDTVKTYRESIILDTLAAARDPRKRAGAKYEAPRKSGDDRADILNRQRLMSTAAFVAAADPVEPAEDASASVLLSVPDRKAAPVAAHDDAIGGDDPAVIVLKM